MDLIGLLIIMYNIYKIIQRPVVVGFLMCFTNVAFAQSDNAINTFTPYSFYGVGDLAKPGMAHNFAMGGIGTGVRSSQMINFLNPAALSAHDSLAFMFDFGAEIQNYYSSYYSNDGQGHHSAANNFNIHHIALAFPVHRRVVIGVGLLPYSNVGYRVRRTDNVPENIVNMGNVYYDYRGEGGINQVSLLVGAGLGKRLSIGGQMQYYFGSIDRYSNIIFASNSTYSNLYSGTSLKVGNFGFTVGSQYAQPLNKDLMLTIGATYQFATQIGKNQLNFAYMQTSTFADTIQWTTTTNNLLSVPMVISGGVSLRKRDHWMAGIDYVYQRWNKTADYENASAFQHFEITPGYLVRAGFEWIPSKTDFRHYFNRCTYRFGLNYEQTYMQFNGNQLKNIGATAGISIPINRWNNNLNLSAEVGKRGTTDDGLIREIYVKIAVSFSIYDIWFVKPKIE